MQAHRGLVPIQTTSSGSPSKPSSARGHSEPAESEPGQTRAGEGFIMRIMFCVICFILAAFISIDWKKEPQMYILLCVWENLVRFFLPSVFLKMVPPAELEDGETDREAEVQPPLIAVPASPVRPSILWTAWVFFRSFFASLVPEAPQAMANWVRQKYDQTGKIRSSTNHEGELCLLLVSLIQDFVFVFLLHEHVVCDFLD